jgi:hypothetical protein
MRTRGTARKVTGGLKRPKPEPEPEPVTLDAALVLIERLRADVERLRAELKSTRLSLEIRRAKCKKAAENLGRVEEILKDLESPAASSSPSVSVSSVVSS